MNVFELPDRRAAWILIAILAVGFIYVLALSTDERSLFARVSGFALAGTVALGGAAMAYISVRERFSVARPSRTLESSPFLFWMDVLTMFPGMPIAAVFMARS